MITLDLVEELLVGVIPGTGDKDAGCGETAEKLAEILEPVRELNLKSLCINKQIYNFFEGPARQCRDRSRNCGRFRNRCNSWIWRGWMNQRCKKTCRKC